MALSEKQTSQKRDRQVYFLSALEESRNRKKALELSGLSRWTIYKWEKEDAWFRERLNAITLTKSDKNEVRVCAISDETTFEESDEEKKEFIVELQREYGVVARALKRTNTLKSTYENWLKDDLIFKKYVDEIKNSDLLVDLAEEKLIDKMREGDMRAITFVLESRGAKRGWVKQAPTTQNNVAVSVPQVVIQQFDGGFFNEIKTTQDDSAVIDAEIETKSIPLKKEE